MFTRRNFLLSISYLIKLSLLIAIILDIYLKQYSTLFLTSVTLLLTFFPALLERSYKIRLPLGLEILILLFIYATLFLGEISDFYEKYWWWDLLLHSFSGILLGILGFIIVYSLNKDKKINLHMTPAFIALFSFTFAVSLGVVWELFEYFMDTLFGFNMQKSGLVDTMEDLIVDSLGALLISISSFVYLNKMRGKFHIVMRKLFKTPQRNL